jgi:predicted transcriptional regulator
MRSGKKEREMGIKLMDLFTKMQQEYPELSPDKVLIMDFRMMRNIATHARVELIEAIRENKPKSVSELARIVDRPQESVSRDLTVLNNYGILEFVRSGQVRKPVMRKELLAVTC